MVFASGFIESNAIDDNEKVMRELDRKNIEANAVNGEKITFLIERNTFSEVKKEIDTLKDIDGVRSVYLAYYSIEESDLDSQKN